MFLNKQDQPLRVKLIDFCEATPASEVQPGMVLQPASGGSICLYLDHPHLLIQQCLCHSSKHPRCSLSSQSLPTDFSSMALVSPPQASRSPSQKLSICGESLHPGLPLLCYQMVASYLRQMSTVKWKRYTECLLMWFDFFFGCRWSACYRFLVSWSTTRSMLGIYIYAALLQRGIDYWWSRIDLCLSWLNNFIRTMNCWNGSHVYFISSDPRRIYCCQQCQLFVNSDWVQKKNNMSVLPLPACSYIKSVPQVRQYQCSMCKPTKSWKDRHHEHFSCPYSDSFLMKLFVIFVCNYFLFFLFFSLLQTSLSVFSCSLEL